MSGAAVMPRRMPRRLKLTAARRSHKVTNLKDNQHKILMSNTFNFKPAELFRKQCFVAIIDKNKSLVHELSHNGSSKLQSVACLVTYCEVIAHLILDLNPTNACLQVHV